MNRRDRGFVLAAILGVVTIAAAIVAGAFFAGLQEYRIGRSTMAAERALRAAESGAAQALDGWDPAVMNAIPAGDSVLFAVPLPSEIGTAVAVVRPLGKSLMLVRARGTDPLGLAFRDVAWLLRLRVPALLVPAVVASESALPAGFSGVIDSTDRAPGGGPCAIAAPPVAPSVAPWAGAWVDWDSLAARAVVGPPAPSGGAPIVLVNNDLLISGGTSNGILMVQGDLDIEAGYRHAGVLLVRGAIRFHGPGIQIAGVLRAVSVTADAAALANGPLVVYSSCAVAAALRLGAAVEPVRQRSWSDLSGGW